VVGLAVLAAVVALLLSDVQGSLSPAEIRARVLSWGPWGPVAFVIAFAVLQPFGVSAHVFIIAATLVWPPLTSLALSLAGALAAATFAFWFARWMGRDWVQARLPARLHRWDEKLVAHGFRTVLVMRLLLFTFGPMQLMLGVSQVRFGAYIAASALGLFPVMAIESFVGASVAAWLLG
jgi:uncharacterized membrane protein YdjX (TVP38/TMEM64 family)